MTTQTRQANTFAGIAFTAVGLFLLVAGWLLFTTRLAIAGYGLWLFVWGLAFLLGALTRYSERRA